MGYVYLFKCFFDINYWEYRTTCDLVKNAKDWRRGIFVRFHCIILNVDNCHIVWTIFLFDDTNRWCPVTLTVLNNNVYLNEPNISRVASVTVKVHVNCFSMPLIKNEKDLCPLTHTRLLFVSSSFRRFWVLSRLKSFGCGTPISALDGFWPRNSKY